MLNRKPEPLRQTMIGAEDAEARFSELIARTQNGEAFLVTKNGQPIARIEPVETFDRERARQAFERLRQLREMQGPPVSEEEAQRNYEELKRELDAEDDEWDEQWLSSSTPR